LISYRSRRAGDAASQQVWYYDINKARSALLPSELSDSVPI